MKRGHFSNEVKRILMQRAGARCMRPECLRETVGPIVSASNKSQVLGVAAHIKAASPGGARFDDSQTEEERHSAENGLWLCEHCAALIDKNNGSDFSVPQLRSYKVASERAALERLMRTSDLIRNNCVQSLIYINIPRLQHHISLTHQALDLPLTFVEGIPGDGYIADELFKLESAISNIRFPALDWREAVGLCDDPTGWLISFEGQFRTKNGPNGRNDRSIRDFSNIQTAPHVYTKNGNLKLILPYDPKFVTTNTAVVEFSSGNIRIGGFGLIKFRKGDEVVASPFIMGLASTPEVRAFWDALSHP